MAAILRPQSKNKNNHHKRKIIEIPHLIEATYISELKIKCTFSDGQQRIADLHHFLTTTPLTQLKEYLDPAIFKHFTFDAFSLEWPGNTLDIDATDIYNNQFSSPDDL